MQSNEVSQYGPSASSASANKPAPPIFRIVWQIIRASGLAQWTAAFAVLFVIVALTVSMAEPEIGTFPNAAWLMFQVVTTIGLGDYTCTSVIGRVATIILSLYSVFFLALITGTLVSYCQEIMRIRRDESVAHFIDQLEHLDELDEDQLRELSEKVRKFKASHQRLTS